MSTQPNNPALLTGMQRILGNAKKHASISVVANTVKAARSVSSTERKRQKNLSRVVLQSDTTLGSASDQISERRELNDENCLKDYKKPMRVVLAERIAKLRTELGQDADSADDNTLTITARAILENELNNPEAWPARCERVLGVSFADVCNEIAGADRSLTNNMVARKAISRITKTEALAMLNRIAPEESIGAQFKQWVRVNPGAAQAEIEKRLRTETPKADPVAIASAATKELNDTISGHSSKWKQFLHDDKMADMLRRAGDAGDDEARELLARYETYKIRLEATNDRDRKNRTHDLFARNQERELTAARDRAEHAHLVSLTNNGKRALPLDDKQVAPCDAARESLNTAAVRTHNEITGEIVSTNALGEANGPRVQRAAEFLCAYTADKSRSTSSARQRLAERLAFGTQQALELHIKFMIMANPDAVFASDGLTMTGNTVDDLIASLRSSGAADDIAPATVVCYLAEWQKCLAESRIDVDNAVALRYRQFDAESVQASMAELGLSREQVEANFAHGLDPDNSEIMKRIMWSANNDWFRATDAQADEKYHHAERAEKIARRAKKRAKKADSSDSATTTTGNSQSRTRAELEASDDDAVKNADPNDAFSIEAQFKEMALLSRAARRLPVIPSDYFPQFMRRGLGKDHGERDCRNGEDCYCANKNSIYPYVSDAKRRGKDFICREFLLPDELDAWKVKRDLPTVAHFCVFCEMFMIAIEYDRYIRDRRVPIKLLHRWAVSIGPGQFNASCMLPVSHEDRWTGIVRPFPRISPYNYVASETLVGNIRVPCMRPTDQLDFRLGSARRTRI